MSSYYEGRSAEIAHFKAEARRAFAGLCAKYGLQESVIPLDADANPFQITFANSHVWLELEGINWGDNTNLVIGPNRVGAPRYNVWQLLRERPAASAMVSGQIESSLGWRLTSRRKRATCSKVTPLCSLRFRSKANEAASR